VNAAGSWFAASPAPEEVALPEGVNESSVVVESGQPCPPGTVSVMAQVGYYKATKGPDGKGKRLFKMAPLHHHLELTGWSELQVVAVFYIIAAFLASVCIMSIK
jgi:hypothetical protein